ncbi:MAG: hypothetical protein ABGX27_09045 [Desulfurobacteriaceae bacterium]
MKVKTYKGKSLTGIIEQLNKAFGNSYAILSVNHRWRWKFFIFPSREVEVVVGIEEKKEKSVQEFAQEPLIQVANYEPLERIIENFLASFKKPPPVGEGKALVFFGPTGSGKTTHIGKTYIDLVSSGLKDIAVMSCDTFRLGAIEQLKIFCGVVDTPFQVVYEPEEFRDMVEFLSGHKVILVDTPGVSVSSKNMEELVKFLNAAETVNIFTLDASKELSVIKKYLEAFNGMIDGIALTKLDEVDEAKLMELKQVIEDYPVYSVSYRQNLTEGFRRLWQ